MAQKEKMPNIPSSDRLLFKVTDRIMMKRGYLEDSEALRDRRYEDGVQIPVLPKDDLLPSDDRKDILLSVYSEICNGWRTLTNVRFKLLGLLPLISGTVLITLLSTRDSSYRLDGHWQVVVGMFGLVVTLGLLIYEKRNSSLYNDLIGRGRQIENELGVHTGHFRGRPEAGKIIKHSAGLNTIYTGTVVVWIIIVLVGLHRMV